ncbi:hypothetical protein [Gimesia aquarii]|uniref:Uncharacterized protein n=1 Tax=Gimesia aquarii TaxID=2527964 RepID=A0A517WNK6_9PLAN|nr:hypothetical protein [Gimesia aquarii]QDU06841.1 hypothetical protein V202x_01840 [Gimesia aquarii]
MGQKDCSYSLIKKPCPRKRFPCSRCGAKIVNADLQWEISVPKYRRWHYLNPETLVPNADAIETPVIVNAPRRLPNFDEEIQGDSPCKFDGPLASEAFNLVQGQSPIEGGQFVQDFEWQRFDSLYDGWNWFLRSHQVLVSWEAAEVEDQSGELITPGRWKIDLTISQSAQVFDLDWEAGANPGWFNLAPGGEFYNIFGGPAATDPTESFGNSSRIKATYYPPSGYRCLSESSTRWRRNIPTLPVLTTGHTIDTLPNDYQWPDGVPTQEDGFLIGWPGPFYPVGFRQSHDIYYAPPFIDVRHVKK